jgi:hypothetical protein
LADNRWQVLPVYDHKKIARAWLGVDAPKKKVIIVFMGAESPPKPLESWWTNQRQGQVSIWRDVNFLRGGIIGYSRKILDEIDRLLKPFHLQNPTFEFTGHSTGGVLAFFAVRHFKHRFPKSHVNALTFGTPNFLSREQRDHYVKVKFADERCYYVNFINQNDPASGIYGPDLFQPENTIIFQPQEGVCFQNTFAASPADTLISNHFPTQYQKLVEQIKPRNRL